MKLRDLGEPEDQVERHLLLPDLQILPGGA